MNADEMFEKLEYKKEVNFENSIRYCGKYNRIIFVYGDKTVRIIGLNVANVGVLNMQELQAINKKCEELGWLDEIKRVNGRDT